MKVEMIRSRGYRGEALEAGRVTDMDAQTATWFIAKGWAKEHAEPAPLTTVEADALIPPAGKRRRAIR